MERQRSILRNSGAGQGEKKKNGVHYKRDSHLLQIIPPREVHGTSSHSDGGGGGSAYGGDAGGGGAGAGGGNGNSKGKVQQTNGEEAVIDLAQVPDDSTPSSYDALQERLDFSVVFGAVQGKYNNNEEYEDESDPPPLPGQKLTKEQRKKARAPEQQITIFAFRLALLEKAASGLGTIGFLWATVVILGGFASTVRLTDFLVVTVIILAETMRTFSRSHELEWQHMSSRSNPGLGLNRLINTFRSFSGRNNGGDSKRRSSSKHIKRAISVPVRSSWENKSSSSPDSDLRTPTNSSSNSSRLNRVKVSATVPSSAPLPRPLPRPNSTQDAYRRTWAVPTVPVVPFFSDVFTTNLVSRVLYFAQIFSALVTIGLSFWRLSDQNFYDSTHSSGGNAPSSAPTPMGSSGAEATTKLPNVVVSMNVFYVLAVVEGGLFLLERSYWEYRIRITKLLDKVCEEDYVGPENYDIVKQFFYDVYAESLKGSVFDGLEMDLVQYSISWLQTEVFNQQLGGARMLNRFVSKTGKLRRKDRIASDVLRRLGTTPGIIERLVEMLSWGSKREEELLREISAIICWLVGYNRNIARFVAVPGAMDGVVSLLLPHGTSSDDPVRLFPIDLQLMALRILKHLCKDHKNSLKIGETRGLLSILMLYIEVRGEAVCSKCHHNVDGDPLKDELKTYKKSLQVLLLLASATNTSGGLLRQRIAKIVSGLKNLRDILEFGTERPELQLLSIGIFYHLAMEDDVRQMIGATGGVIRILFDLFANYRSWFDEGPAETQEDRKIREERKLASQKAGETLTRLVLQNPDNCIRLLELKNDKKEKILVQVMVDAVCSIHDKIATSAAQILRSVMKYAEESTKKEIATRSVALVVKKIFVRTGALTKSEMYETSLGLAARILEPLDSETYREILRTVNKAGFVEQLMRNLHHTPTTNKYPRIRRFSVELIIALVEKDDSFLDTFTRHNLDLKSVLEKTLDSISEVENFCLFSGLVGYTEHTEKIESLVKKAIAAVDSYHERTTSTAVPDPLAT